MGNLSQFNLYLTNDEKKSLSILSDKSGLKKAELMRRMIDYCFQDWVLDKLIPHVSGTISVGDRR